MTQDASQVPGGPWRLSAAAKCPPSVPHAVCSATVFASPGGGDGESVGVYWHSHEGGRCSVNLPPIPWHTPCPALPNGALPWAPSLTQSPWLANAPSAFHPPCWQSFAVTLLPPLAAAAGPAATTLTTMANAA